MNKTSIVILTYNNLRYTKLCVESILKLTPAGSYEIILIDNASNDGTVDWLKGLEGQNGIKVILNDRNLGFPAGCNQGIIAAEDGNDILLLNNDTIVTPRWLENLQTCLYSDKSIGAVGAVTNSCSNFQAIPTDYKDFSELLSFAGKINAASDPSKWEERVRLIGFCLLIKNETVNTVGFLDEMYGLGNCEDDDYSVRIRKAGYKLMLCGDCFIHHFGSASFSKNNAGFNELLRKNREKFTLKWGFDPLLLAIDERNIIAPYIDKMRSARNILVVNSGCGAMPLYLKKFLPECELTGLETNRLLPFGLADTVRVFDDFKSLGNRKFDIIILLSVWRNDVDIRSQAEIVPNFLAGMGSILLTSETDEHKILADLLCFKGFKKSFSPGAALLQSQSGMAIKKMSLEDIISQEFEIGAKTNPDKAIAFLLRRIENGFDEEKNTENLGQILAVTDYSTKDLEAIARKSCVNKSVAFNALGTVFYRKGDKKRALDMFLNSNAADKNYCDGAFNLAYLLFEINEKAIALKVINECASADDELLRLKKEIMQNL